MQLLETSGVADAAPLAASLSAAGFRLTGVVAVVDVEAGLELLQQEIAQAQVTWKGDVTRQHIMCRLHLLHLLAG